MNLDNNPFSPPAATVGDFDARRERGNELVLSALSQPAGAGIAWLRGGWELFKLAPGLWIGLLLALFVISFVLGLIPYVGFLLSSLLSPLFLAGLMLGCKAVDEGEPLRFDHLFAGFAANPGSLLGVGLLYLAGMVAIIVLVGIVIALGGVSIVALGSGALSPLFMLVLILFALLCFVPLLMAFWFAPLLVALHDVPAVAAMQASFSGCQKNVLPFLIYGAVMIPLGLLALIPLGLGLIILVPVGYLSMYTSYRSIFIRPAA